MIKELMDNIRALKQYQRYKEWVEYACYPISLRPTFITFREFKERIKDHESMKSIIIDTVISIKESDIVEQSIIERYYNY